MFNIISEPLPGCYTIQSRKFEDDRGNFVKTYHAGLWNELGIDFQMQEEFYSFSKEGVLRGMHYQAPPAAHNKIVYCLTGRLLDVLLDLRTDSSTFGQAVSVALQAVDGRSIFIPKGIAHGFYAHEDNTCLVYKTDHIYSPKLDTGVHWRSFDFDWPNPCPIHSKRDGELPAFSNIRSPF